jgi:hypothetical protein
VQPAVVAGPIVDGTVLNKAPDDVGGLLDTSKGWTLNIPGPEDSQSAASKLIAAQEHKGPAAAKAQLASAVPVAAIR